MTRREAERATERDAVLKRMLKMKPMPHGKSLTRPAVKKMPRKIAKAKQPAR